MDNRDVFSASVIEKAFYTDGESFVMMSPEQVGQRLSPYGNYFYNITDDDIEALKHGKILYSRDEYGTAIRYQNDKLIKDHEEKGR